MTSVGIHIEVHVPYSKYCHPLFVNYSLPHDDVQLNKFHNFLVTERIKGKKIVKLYTI